MLWAQLEEAESITQARLASWDYYHQLLEPLENQGLIRRPIIPSDCQHNAHMYYILVAPGVDRQLVLEEFKRNDILSVFHYVPLHSSPAGKRYGRVHGALPITDDLSERLVRLPLWVGLTKQQQDKVVGVLESRKWGVGSGEWGVGSRKSGSRAETQGRRESE